MFQYDVFENRTDIKLATVSIHNIVTIDIETHLIIDLETGHEIRFESTLDKNDTIIIRPSIRGCDIYIRNEKDIEQCLTESSCLNEQESAFYAMSYIQ